MDYILAREFASLTGTMMPMSLVIDWSCQPIKNGYTNKGNTDKMSK